MSGSELETMEGVMKGEDGSAERMQTLWKLLHWPTGQSFKDLLHLVVFAGDFW